MKIGWGTAIVIALLAFIGFIMFFFVKIKMNNAYDHQLVTEDYYKQELAFQKEIDQEEQAQKDGVQLRLTQNDGQGVWLTFPEKVQGQSVQGVVSFYRPSNQALDFSLPLTLDGLKMHIPHAKLVSGRWNVKVSYQINGKDYISSFKIKY